MLFRFFLYSKDKIKSQYICEDILKPISQHIIDEKYNVIEPYWKYDDMYQVEMNIKLDININHSDFRKFLSSISDKWELFGDPPDEILISEKMHDCHFIADNVSLINIFA